MRLSKCLAFVFLPCWEVLREYLIEDSSWRFCLAKKREKIKNEKMSFETKAKRLKRFKNSRLTINGQIWPGCRNSFYANLMTSTKTEKKKDLCSWGFLFYFHNRMTRIRKLNCSYIWCKHKTGKRRQWPMFLFLSNVNFLE